MVAPLDKVGGVEETQSEPGVYSRPWKAVSQAVVICFNPIILHATLA